MGCNCGNKNSKFNYIYTSGAGKQTTYNTEVEAKAAKIRDNNSGSIRQVPKV